MYVSKKNDQTTFFDFNASCSMQLDKNNEWIILADTLEWEKMEKESHYSENFHGDTGHPAKPFRMAIGALIIQKRKNLSDRALVKEISENPYLQYFIGCTSFATKCPFTAPCLVAFRKRLTSDIIMICNEVFLATAAPTPEHKDDDPSKTGDTISSEKDDTTSSETTENSGTVIFDATCSPSNIEYTQDFALLNKAREKLEKMIDYFHEEFHPWKKPRTYRKIARKTYLALARSKKRTAKKIRSEIRRQLEHVRRDIGYVKKYIDAGYSLPSKYEEYFETICELYKQQKYMYDNKTHHVEDRIVSISQPHIRPIVRGKAKSPVEFGAKYDVSIDEKGHARLEKISFDPYNEGTFLQEMVEGYYERTGHYPKRVLVDKIYRTRENIAFCKEHGIRLSGPKLGRKKADGSGTSKEEYKDNIDRIEVERFFSLDKRCNGAGLIMTKLSETTISSIAMSVFVTNLFAVPTTRFFCLFFLDNNSSCVMMSFIEMEP